MADPTFHMECMVLNQHLVVLVEPAIAASRRERRITFIERACYDDDGRMLTPTHETIIYGNQALFKLRDLLDNLLDKPPVT